MLLRFKWIEFEKDIGLLHSGCMLHFKETRFWWVFHREGAEFGSEGLFSAYLPPCMASCCSTIGQHVSMLHRDPFQDGDGILIEGSFGS